MWYDSLFLSLSAIIVLYGPCFLSIEQRRFRSPCQHEVKHYLACIILVRIAVRVVLYFGNTRIHRLLLVLCTHSILVYFIDATTPSPAVRFRQPSSTAPPEVTGAGRKMYDSCSSLFIVFQPTSCWTSKVTRSNHRQETHPEPMQRDGYLVFHLGCLAFSIVLPTTSPYQVPRAWYVLVYGILRSRILFIFQQLPRVEHIHMMHVL